jgi:hypothetical protein
MGICEVLTLIFVTLKLTHVTDWSWWTVFIPEYISVGLGLLWLAVIGVVASKTKKRVRNARR